MCLGLWGWCLGLIAGEGLCVCVYFIMLLLLLMMFSSIGWLVGWLVGAEALESIRQAEMLTYTFLFVCLF